MRKYLFLLSMPFFIGCVTALPLSSEETCSLENMSPGAVTIGNENGMTTASSYGQNNIYVNSSSASRQVTCRPPQTEQEKCSIEASRKSFYQKDQFNSGVSSKRFLVGAGYVFYIIPGLLANNYYEGKRTEALSAAQEVYSSTSASCEKKEVRLPTSK